MGTQFNKHIFYGNIELGWRVENFQHVLRFLITVSWIVLLLPNNALLLFTFRVLNQHHLKRLVAKALVHAHQEFQEFPESQDPRDQQVYPEIRDHRDSQVQRDRPETRVMQGPREAKVHRAYRDLQAPSDVTGNSAFGRI